MTCARWRGGGRSGRGRLCCMRAGRASAMAQMAGTRGGNGGEAEEGGTGKGRKGDITSTGHRGATSRALKFSLCKHGSRHASHKTRQRYLARLRLATGKLRPCVCACVCARTYIQHVYTCISVYEIAARYTQASPRERTESPASPALVAYSSVLGARTRILTRACVLIGLVGR